VADIQYSGESIRSSQHSTESKSELEPQSSPAASVEASSDARQREVWLQVYNGDLGIPES
jgi:hypothetical protein